VSEAEAEREESAGKRGRGAAASRLLRVPGSAADPCRLSGGGPRVRGLAEMRAKRRERRGAEQGPPRGGGPATETGIVSPSAKRTQNGGGSGGGRAAAAAAGECSAGAGSLPESALRSGGTWGS